MQIAEIKERRLREGQRIYFDNSAFIESIESDELRGAEVWHESGLPGWANGYKIQFNGELIHSSKTFKSLMSRLQKLADKWNLEIIEVDENDGDNYIN